jgi:ABC-type ATPase with predicted acetyltransferase domain
VVLTCIDPNGNWFVIGNVITNNLETGEITKTLCIVGFASPPDWLKAYDCLSQGEKMRVDIARALCLTQNEIVFDEFTSVVDREIAKVSAYAISKAVRRSKKKFIAVTCHYDVVDWLDPDWVFSTDTMEFSRKKESGRPLSSKFIGAAQAFGRCFGNITI